MALSQGRPPEFAKGFLVLSIENQGSELSLADISAAWGLKLKQSVVQQRVWCHGYPSQYPGWFWGGAS